MEEKLKLSRKEVKERTQLFWDCLERYNVSGDKKSWDTMFQIVIDLCTNISKSMCCGCYNPWFYDRSMDAAVYCMQLLKRGQGPEYLYTWCRYSVLRSLYADKVKREDRNVQLSVYKEEIEYNESSTEQDD